MLLRDSQCFVFLFWKPLQLVILPNLKKTVIRKYYFLLPQGILSFSLLKVFFRIFFSQFEKQQGVKVWN